MDYYLIKIASNNLYFRIFYLYTSAVDLEMMKSDSNVVKKKSKAIL